MSSYRRIHSALLVCALKGSVLCISTATAAGAVFNVNTTGDPVGGLCAATCSLRQAVSAANLAVGADTINVPAGSYTLTQAGVDDTNVAGDLDITGSVTISGAGAASTTVNGNGGVTGDRAFDMPGATTPAGTSVTISGVTISGGRTSATNNSGAGARDGAASTSLVLSRVIVTGNATDTSGLGPVGEGGGVVEDDGVVAIQDSIVRGNVANFGGGATENGANTLNVIRSTISWEQLGHLGRWRAQRGRRRSPQRHEQHDHRQHRDHWRQRGARRWDRRERRGPGQHRVLDDRRELRHRRRQEHRRHRRRPGGRA